MSAGNSRLVVHFYNAYGFEGNLLFKSGHRTSARDIEIAHHKVEESYHDGS
jgi:hypothetical protein